MAVGCVCEIMQNRNKNFNLKVKNSNICLLVNSTTKLYITKYKIAKLLFKIIRNFQFRFCFFVCCLKTISIHLLAYETL